MDGKESCLEKIKMRNGSFRKINSWYKRKYFVSRRDFQVENKELKDRSTAFLNREHRRLWSLRQKLFDKINKVEEGTKQFDDIAEEIGEICKQDKKILNILIERA